ncbi:MAG TPA: hypothetical protein VGG75_25050 [Trebonia sp.]
MAEPDRIPVARPASTVSATAIATVPMATAARRAARDGISGSGRFAGGSGASGSEAGER